MLLGSLQLVPHVQMWKRASDGVLWSKRSLLSDITRTDLGLPRAPIWTRGFLWSCISGARFGWAPADFNPKSRRSSSARVWTHTGGLTTKAHSPETGLCSLWLTNNRWRELCKLITWAFLAADTELDGGRSTCWHALYIILSCHICGVHTQAAQWPAAPKLMRRGTHGVKAPTGCWLSSPQAGDACCLCLAAVPV